MPRAEWKPDPKMQRRFAATRRRLKKLEQDQLAIDQEFARYYIEDEVPFVALAKAFKIDRQTLARHVAAARAANTTTDEPPSS